MIHRLDIINVIKVFNTENRCYLIIFVKNLGLKKKNVFFTVKKKEEFSLFFVLSIFNKNKKT